jgi:hypothetical protein
MAEVDTSSYPKMPVAQQQNPLDTISKIQGIQRNQLGIDKQKLENYNEKYNIVHRSLGNLVNEPDLTGDHFINTYQDLVKSGVMTPEQAAKEMTMVPTKVGSKSEQDYQQRLRKLAETQLLQAQEKHDALTHYFGQNASVDNGNQTIFGNQGAIRPTGTGAGPAPFQQTGASLPKQLPVGTAGFGPNGEPQFQGPATAPPQFIPPVGKGDKPPRLPVNNGPAVGEAATPAERVGQGAAAANTISPGPPINFTEGKEQYNKDIAVATDKLNQIKPAQQALKLMTPEILSGLTGTGPIAKKASEVLSALKGVGVIPTSIDDPVAQRQEVVKKLARYLSDNPAGQRSDEAQRLVQKANADPDYHLLPALVNLTRDNIALDRVQAARALSFEDKNFSKYPLHRAGFPNAIDERAFKLDLMPAKERDELIDKIKNTDSKTEREKFINSLRIAKKLKMFD